MLNKIKSNTRKSAKAKQSVPSKNDGVKSLLSDEDRYYPSKRLMVCRVCNDNKVSDQTEKLVWVYKNNLFLAYKDRKIFLLFCLPMNES